MFLCEALGKFPEKSMSSICSLCEKKFLKPVDNFGSHIRISAGLRAEKQAPESVVSRWFLRTGSMEEVSRLNIGFGFIRSCMKAGKRLFKDCGCIWILPAHADSRKAR